METFPYTNRKTDQGSRGRVRRSASNVRDNITAVRRAGEVLYPNDCAEFAVRFFDPQDPLRDRVIAEAAYEGICAAYDPDTEPEILTVDNRFVDELYLVALRDPSRERFFRSVRLDANKRDKSEHLKELLVYAEWEDRKYYEKGSEISI